MMISDFNAAYFPIFVPDCLWLFVGKTLRYFVLIYKIYFLSIRLARRWAVSYLGTEGIALHISLIIFSMKPTTRTSDKLPGDDLTISWFTLVL